MTRVLIMAWGEWMVPELTPSAAFELETQKRQLRTHAAEHPVQVTELAMKLLEQSFMLQSVLKKATHHIAELELQQILSEDDEPIEMRSSRQSVPRVLRLLLWLYGYRLGPSPASPDQCEASPSTYQ